VQLLLAQGLVQAYVSSPAITTGKHSSLYPEEVRCMSSDTVLLIYVYRVVCSATTADTGTWPNCCSGLCLRLVLGDHCCKLVINGEEEFGVGN
jgi:hypothetical protein